jgi:hypothetical protein
VVVVEVDTEHRVRQSFDNLAFDLDGFFFVRHTPYSSTDSGLTYYHKRRGSQTTSIVGGAMAEARAWTCWC